MGEIAARLADRVWVTSDNPRTESPEAIVEEVLVGVVRVSGGAGRHVAMPDRQEAIHDALGWARGGDVVVIAGKGHETYQVVGSDGAAVRRSGGGARVPGAGAIGRRGRMFTVEDVVRGTKGALVGGDLGVPVSEVSIDTRTLPVGAAFFAIQGQTDGHRHLKDAMARGAACLVVHALPDDLPATVAVVLVDETTKALGRLAAYHRARFTLPVAAVTGSNGKTTTKEMMAGVLGGLGPVLKPEASFNNQWGLPLTRAPAHRRPPRGGARDRHQPARRDRGAGGHRATHGRRR